MAVVSPATGRIQRRRESAEPDLLHRVQADAAVNEGLCGRRETKAECTQKHAHFAPQTGSRWRRLEGASAQAGEERADPATASEEAPAQRLCHGVAWRIGTSRPQRGEEGLALGIAGQERPEDRGAVLATRDAKVRQQRHGPADPRAQQPAHPNPRHAISLQEHESVVVPMQAEAMQGISSPRPAARGPQHCFVLASSSVTIFGGIGTGPQLPWVPFLMWLARVTAASFTPAFLAATSFKAGPTSLLSTMWQPTQGLLLNKASPSWAKAGCRLNAAAQVF